MKSKKKSYALLNYTLLFLLAYVSVHLIQLLTKYFCVNFIDLEQAQLYFSYIYYVIEEDFAWTRMKVFILYGVPTLAMAIFGLVFLLLRENFSYQKSFSAKFYFHICFLLTLSFFISDFIKAPFERDGITIVMEWMYFKKEIIYGISLLFWISIPIIAYFTHKSIVKLAHSNRFIIDKKAKMEFIFTFIILGFLLAIVFYSLLIFTGNKNYISDHFFRVEIYRILTFLAILFFVAIFNYNNRSIGVARNKNIELINISFIVFTIVSIIVVFLALTI